MDSVMDSVGTIEVKEKRLKKILFEMKHYLKHYLK